MRPSSPSLIPSFGWQAALLILPVAILALVGLSFLRQDRDLALQEAREHCQSVAQDLLRQCVNTLTNTAKPETPLKGVPPGKQTLSHSFAAILNETGGLVYPRPYVSSPIPLDLRMIHLSHEQVLTWEAARNADFKRLDPNQIAGLWKQFMALNPPPEYAALGQFALALALERQGSSETAQAYEKCIQDYPDAVGETGLPLQFLAGWRRLLWVTSHEASSPANSAPRTELDTLCADLVEHPNAATAIILRDAMRAFHGTSATNQVLTWQALWEQQEHIRMLYAQSRPLLHESASLLSQDAFRWFWTPSSPRWLAGWFVDQQWIAWQSEAEVQARLEKVLNGGSVIPKYCAATLELGGTRLFSTPGPIGNTPNIATNPAGVALPAILATATFPDDGANAFKITLYLSNPAPLYARHRVRVWWLGGIIVLSILGAGIGLMAIHGNLERQLRLNEMKSNFVSSVTHELRAPIASVRLMAESLERGKIPQAEKRQEYYRFIVQECRRLSALIENVLDFARIEQGRKQYHMEEVDLASLIHQTVQVLEPYASEHQVKLAWQPPGNDLEPVQIHCDAHAIQQALINLVDNALKHSPAGAEVLVGLDAQDHKARLWVEDSGPGIPPEEHERIFEQFYRRGSELRRESTGIGIGLTLVRHIVQAHRGQVQVRSAAGQGSRFTLILPMDLP